MKGIVFTEFIDMVEEKFGLEVVDNIITKSKVESNGVYTAIGTYPHNEIIQLVTALSQEIDVPVRDLVKTYGRYLFGTFNKSYPAFFEKCDNAFDFLENVESYIHPEVKKIYPDAELPSFDSTRISETELEMIYSSPRKMFALADGLIEKTLVYYQQKGTVSHKLIKEDGSVVKFSIVLNG
jgi:hypothetical protein